MSEFQTLVELSGVTVRSGETLAFQNTHWVFKRRQQWALVGPNGSGKTLFACALAGQVPVIGGDISYRFRLSPGRTNEDAISLVSFELQKAIAGDAPAAVRWFSMEMDDAASVRQLLSRESVCEINPFEVREDSPQSLVVFERRKRSLLKLLQIDALMDRQLPALSNGEMRKMLIARALLRQPCLLILDDPFAGLDSRFRTHLKRILTALMRHPSFHVLLIAKHPDELPRGITHLLCVNACQVIAQGPVRAMLSDRHVRALFNAEKRLHRIAKPLLSFPASRNTSDGAELVRLERISIAYSGHTILENINWSIRRGESWALLGPNGSGKSTLLSLITGENPQAYANIVNIFGRRRGSGENVWALRKRIGWMSPELHMHFPEEQTCLETVLTGFRDSYGCYERPSAIQRRIAKQWLECFRLTEYSKEWFGSLSSGLQRMMLLARALVKSPELLVLDEPCQGLDLAHRRIFLQIIEALIRQNHTTIIYVTHRSDEIPQGVRRVLQLHKRSSGRGFQSSGYEATEQKRRV